MKVLNILLVLLLSLTKVYSQDTLKLDFQTAEKLFLDKNLEVVANHYNIDINKAQIRQSKLWDNPTISTDQNIFDNGSHKFFYHSAPIFGTNDPNGLGQFYIQLSQVIKTGHKIGKLVNIATDQTLISENQFDDLVHNIRFSIHNDILQLSYYDKQESIYKTQIDELSKVKDTSGLVNSIIFNLTNDRIGAHINRMSTESELKTLLGIRNSIVIYPKLNYKLVDIINLNLDNIVIYDSLETRPDIKLSENNIRLSMDNLSYQKSLVSPDVTVGVEWDQRSSYATNYWGLVLSFPLPILNQNQWNIKSGKLAVSQQQANLDQIKFKSYNELQLAYASFLYYQKINNSDQLYYSTEDFKLLKNSMENFQAGKIQLSDFIISLSSFKDNRLKVLDQHQNLLKSVEILNFLSNKTIFRF